MVVVWIEEEGLIDIDIQVFGDGLNRYVCLPIREVEAVVVLRHVWTILVLKQDLFILVHWFTEDITVKKVYVGISSTDERERLIVVVVESSFL